MKKLFAVLLSCALLFTGVNLAFADGGKGLRAVKDAVTKSPAKRVKTGNTALTNISKKYRELESMPAMTSEISRFGQATRLNYAKHGAESEATVMDQVFNYEGKVAPLTETQLTDLATGKASVADLTAAEQKFFYETGLLKQVGEREVAPSPAVVKNAMAYYRRTLAESSNEAEAMGAVTNIGFFGLYGTTSPDAHAIVQAAKKFGEEFDQVAANALLLMGAEKRLQELADFRLSQSGSLAKSWGQYKRSANEMNLSLSIPNSAATRELGKWNMQFQRRLGLHNPYSLLFWADNSQVFADLRDFRQVVQNNISQGYVEHQVLRNLHVKPVQAHGVEGTFSATLPATTPNVVTSALSLLGKGEGALELTPTRVPVTPATGAQAALARVAAAAPTAKELATFPLLDRLVGEETSNLVKSFLGSLSRNLEKARALPLTAAQQQRLQEAEKYFWDLTPEQANNAQTLLSASFRKHAMVVRSPQAQQYGYFIQGGESASHGEALLEFGAEEFGYIPAVTGDMATGFSKEELSQMIRSAEKTDQPILVFWDTHGGVEKGKFLSVANAETDLTTAEIVDYMRQLRQVTQTPELNLYMPSCHAGTFLDEFEKIPLAQREGINVFVNVGAQQCDLTDNSIHVRWHNQDIPIVNDLVKNMVSEIMHDGSLYVQANIRGQSFNPLEIAKERAKSLGQRDLSRSLKIKSALQKTNRSWKAKMYDMMLKKLGYNEQMERYFVGRATAEKAESLFGSTLPKEELDLAGDLLKKEFAKRRGLDSNAAELQWNRRFGFNQPDEPWDAIR